MKVNQKKIIIFPTDTVYGIGVRIDDKYNLKKIYQIKKRDFNKPISILFFSLQQIEKIVFLDNEIKKKIHYFWPGSVTLIVHVRLSCDLYKKEKKIGIRMPNHPLALKILKKEGPLRTTSINQSGEPPLNNYQEIKKKYQNKVDYIYYDNNKNHVSSGISSTVIDTTTFYWNIIRKGEKKNIIILKNIFSKYFFNKKHF
ncbi:tRNA threonylcarbamoyl adenosine modification protein, Sua5/YciO/YrdC/YwlC family [Candidatus Phytoplasma oryzae]|uniref:L-threonylcarbamoyladenylate synthase n=1 Tax=Candidatus Phytoplasma oryzae TaxID=203274 RepID=A0A139JR99_9MOLU|nr:L-threonylcarbamoyladenylate synthase [Candidatus Phytoplasma oryzae]KXT29406.1 tRNA threonylcarbamoyl adenosine modification protein, Sua5/YciO/YrdC/YwlC family [Candidatus Phytoplasma oryzae]RAM57989.1 translation factor [Candidatus Phytoplasma oryzae]